MVAPVNYKKHGYCMEREGLEKLCPFSAEKGVKDPANPHYNEDQSYNKKKIKDSILDCVGNTPMVRINNITRDEGIKCEVFAKCEFLNPGGSVKDRIGRRMVLDAEREGKINQGDILIEPTSGNTGVGLSMAAAARGYKMIITMPEKMSFEKRSVLTALGAEIIRTPNEMQFDNADSHIGIAVDLQNTLPNAHILDQYKNPANPLAHYDGTGQEIFDQLDGKVDYVVLGTGTGGTICGVARKLKELDPNIQVIGVDPIGSILAQPEELNVDGEFYHVEGIGYDFIPRVLDRQYVDKWYKSVDAPGFEYARKLIKQEGLLCGGSSGTAMAVAMEIARTLPEGKRVVAVCPDNIRNYITKFVNNDWMYENGFISEEDCVKLNTTTLVENKNWGQEYTIKDLNLADAMCVQTVSTVNEVLDKMQEHNFDQFPVQDASGVIVGMIDSARLSERLIKKKLTIHDPIELIVFKDFRHVSSAIKLDELGRLFERKQYVIVDKKSVCTHNDLLNFIKAN
jgi:cystathionine beta-synthase